MSADALPAMDTDEEGGPIRPGLRMGNYQLERELGLGGFGTVYAARHIGLDKPVVIKALHPTLAMSERAVLRFVREGRAASRIRHPHVVDVTDVGTHDGIPFLVMEYLDGEDLEDRLKKVGRLTCAQAAEVLLPVLDAVAMAHEQGVVHRDLKPSNIFLATDHHGAEVPMVLDFGIAKILDAEGVDRVTLTRAASFVGTAYYASPEQAKSGKDADAFSDQYSLGAILFQIVSGTLPAIGGTPFEVLSKIVAGESSSIEAVMPDIDPRMAAVIERAMRYEKTSRYPSLREMGQGLLQVAQPEIAARWRSAFGGREASASGTHAVASVGVPPTAASFPAVDASIAQTAPPSSGVPLAAPARNTQATSPTRVPAKKSGGRPMYLALAFLLAAMVVGVAGGLGYYLSQESRAVSPPELVAEEAPPPAEAIPDEATPAAPRLWQVTNEGARVEVDGQLVEARPVPIPSDARAHRVRVTLAGHRPHEARISADQAEIAPLTLEPEADSEPTAEPDPEASTEAQATAERDTETESPEEPEAAAARRTDARGRTARPGSRGTWSNRATGNRAPVNRGSGRSFNSRGQFGGSGTSSSRPRQSGRNGAFILH